MNEADCVQIGEYLVSQNGKGRGVGEKLVEILEALCVYTCLDYRIACLENKQTLMSILLWEDEYHWANVSVALEKCIRGSGLHRQVERGLTPVASVCQKFKPRSSKANTFMYNLSLDL